mgnify:CR=1 FL=1
MDSDLSDAIWVKRWEEYLAKYPGDFPIKHLEHELSYITAAKLRGDPIYHKDAYSVVAQMISKKLEELKQARTRRT